MAYKTHQHCTENIPDGEKGSCDVLIWEGVCMRGAPGRKPEINHSPVRACTTTSSHLNFLPEDFLYWNTPLYWIYLWYELRVDGPIFTHHQQPWPDMPTSRCAVFEWDQDIWRYMTGLSGFWFWMYLVMMRDAMADSSGCGAQRRWVSASCSFNVTMCWKALEKIWFGLIWILDFISKDFNDTTAAPCWEGIAEDLATS